MNDENTDLEPTNVAQDSPYTQLSGTFGGADLTPDSAFYNVNEANALIEKLKDALRKSTNGARLLDLAEKRSVKVHLIKSKKLQSATTPDMNIFLAAEAGQKSIQIPQLLEFGGALREIEQFLMGYKVPPKDSDPLERANLAHTKMLDKIVYMCRIGIDLENIYGNQIREAIEAFGFEDIYKAQVDALSEEEIENIYNEAQKKAFDDKKT